MPHNFIKLPPATPNPGPWTLDRLQSLCAKHDCRLEHAWSADRAGGAARYVLVEYGDQTGNGGGPKALHDDLGAEEVVELYKPADG